MKEKKTALPPGIKLRISYAPGHLITTYATWEHTCTMNETIIFYLKPFP